MKHPEQLDEFGFRFSCHDRAGDVRAVPDAVAEAEGAAEVAHDDLVLGDHAWARLVVRAGGVGPAPDDGEIDTLMARIAQPGGDVGGDLGLRPSYEGDLAAHECRRHGIRGRAGGPQSGHFLCVLDGPQRADDLSALRQWA